LNDGFRYCALFSRVLPWAITYLTTQVSVSK
jgi:hypothetical protein